MKLILTIDRIEGDQAILKTESSETLTWPKKLLPADIKESMVLEFSIDYSQQTEEAKIKTAKEILNELLNTDDK